MLNNRAALGALAVIGTIAAGSGAYFATRQHPAELQPAPAHDTSLPAGPAAVTETENSIAPVPTAEPPKVAAEPPAAPRPASVSRPAPQSVRTTRASTPAPAQRQPARPSYAPAPTPPAAASTTPAPAPPMPSADRDELSIADRRPPPVPEKQFEDLVIPADSVVGLQIESSISSDQAKIEDPVRARVTRDVKVHDQVAIPAGARAEGAVTLVDRGGRLKDQARLGIRFHTIVLADGTRLPINTETIYRDGDSPARESAAKIGAGAVGGAVLGAILGGKKGALIGSTVGAGAGGAAVMASDPDPATLPAGATVTVRMTAPATVTVEK